MDQVLSKTPEVVFTIRCGGCDLPVIRLDGSFTPSAYKKMGIPYEILLVRGDATPSKNVKYFPAMEGLKWAKKAGLIGPGKTMFFPSSGNFLYSADQIVKEEGIELELVGVVSSSLGAGKLKDLQDRNIRLITERDLAKELGLPAPVHMFEMLKQHSRNTGIPILHQYDCVAQDGWNFKSYRPIARDIIRHLGGKISIFVATVGTIGKYRGVGVPIALHASMRFDHITELVAAFPYPGYAFPGGRDEEGIGHVGNSFGITPVRRTTNYIAVHHLAAQLYEAGIPVGITSAAEVLTGIQFSLEKLRPPYRPEDIMFDGVIRILVVASDTIGPYIEDGKEVVPELFSKMVDPRR